MLRTGVLWLLISIITVFNSYGSSDHKEERNILVISAFSPTNPVYKIILDGIRQPLQEEFGNTYNMHTEYLETDRFPEEEIVQKHVNLCNEKYRKIKSILLSV